MSEGASRTPDISKIISIIMENPDILERISSLARGTEAEAAAPTEADTERPASAISAPTVASESKNRRSQLLYAIKPYVRQSRREAIDTVIAIADIVDMMRRK